MQLIRNFLKKCDFENGYKQAVLDILNYIDKHSEVLKRNKLFSYNGIRLLLRAIQDNHDVFFRNKDETEFVYTNDKKIILEKKVNE